MKSRKVSALLLLTIVTLAGACRRNQATNSPPSAGNAPVASSPIAPAASPSPTAPAVQTAYFNGSIGENNGLQMKLIREGDKLTGTYSYQRNGATINLKGTIDKDGNVTLDEFDPAGKPTGNFKGIWKAGLEDGLASIAGNWSKPGSDKKIAFSVHQQPIEFTGSAEVVAKQIKETNKKLNYKIEVGYPEIKATLDTRFDKFNLEAKNLVTRMVAAFKKEQADLTKDETVTTPTSDLGSSLNGTYTIAIANDSLISGLFILDGYSAGAAHGHASSSVLNFDLKAGKVLKLADLFKPGAKYLPTIAAFCAADLRKQSKQNGNSLPEDMIKSGSAPTAENYRSWTITPKGLRITFDEYQVGSYAVGPQTVLVPYAALKDLIKPDGPIGAYAK